MPKKKLGHPVCTVSLHLSSAEMIAYHFYSRPAKYWLIRNLVCPMATPDKTPRSVKVSTNERTTARFSLFGFAETYND